MNKRSESGLKLISNADFNGPARVNHIGYVLAMERPDTYTLIRIQSASLSVS